MLVCTRCFGADNRAYSRIYYAVLDEKVSRQEFAMLEHITWKHSPRRCTANRHSWARFQLNSASSSKPFATFFHSPNWVFNDLKRFIRQSQIQYVHAGCPVWLLSSTSYDWHCEVQSLDLHSHRSHRLVECLVIVGNWKITGNSLQMKITVNQASKHSVNSQIKMESA